MDTSVKEIVIPEEIAGYPVRYIGYEAFAGCNLTSVTIPNGVRSIYDSAFNCCESLTSVTIPKSVKFIDYMAFNYCPSLKVVYYGGTESDWDNITMGID